MKAIFKGNTFTVLCQRLTDRAAFFPITKSFGIWVTPDEFQFI